MTLELVVHPGILDLKVFQWNNSPNQMIGFRTGFHCFLEWTLVPFRSHEEFMKHANINTVGLFLNLKKLLDCQAFFICA